MRDFLVFLPLPEQFEAMLERILKTATSSFEAVGDVKRTNLGTFSRAASKKGREIVSLVVVSAPASASVEQDVSRARMIEGAIRATLSASGVPAHDVRVFAANAPTVKAPLATP
jgi:hypothetical protein